MKALLAFVIFAVVAISTINAQSIVVVEDESVEMELNSVITNEVEFGSDKIDGQNVTVQTVIENGQQYVKFLGVKNVYFYCYTESGKKVTKKFDNKIELEKITKLENKYSSISFNCTSEKKGHFMFNSYNRPWKIESK